MVFDYSKDYVLENEFARLSPLHPLHVHQLLPIADDPDIWKYLMEDCLDERSLKHYVRSAATQRDKKMEYPFLVFDKMSQRAAGTTRLYEINASLGVLKIGHTWYGSNARGSGLNKAVKYLLFQFVFDQLNFSRVGFGVHEKNKRSLSALHRLGCVKEGVLRNFLPSKDFDQRYDIVLLSLLRNEWWGKTKPFLESWIQNELA